MRTKNAHYFYRSDRKFFYNFTGKFKFKYYKKIIQNPLRFTKEFN